MAMFKQEYMAPKCNAPFLPEANYPATGGGKRRTPAYIRVTTDAPIDIAARFCVTFEANGPSCCLPCPTSYWLFSDNFPWRVRIASYISIFSLVCNAFLLLTFIVLPQEKSHRHYLSIGLTSSFILIAIAFIIPLGTQPDLCYNAITPNNEKTQASCAGTGVLLELGAMGAVVWSKSAGWIRVPLWLLTISSTVLLRAIWTLLRITINLKRIELFKKISIGIGIALPILFLAISLPITSVSYSLGDICVPANPSSLWTWFLWVIIFSFVSWVIQVGTIVYCIVRFASVAFAGKATGAGTGHSTSTSVTSADVEEPSEDVPPSTPVSRKPMTPRGKKRLAWRRARGILSLQWRSIVLAFIIANLSIFFSMFFISEKNATKFQYESGAPIFGPDNPNFKWVACLMANGGNKDICLDGERGISISENRVVACLVLASVSKNTQSAMWLQLIHPQVIGMLVFLLMVRTSMFKGWWTLLRNPRGFFRRPSLDNETELVGGSRFEPSEKAPDESHEADADDGNESRPSTEIVE